MDPDQRIKDIKEVSIAIDDWDDIFSDFDPRPLGERALSEDFIAELKKRYRETRKGTFLVNIFAPISLKDEKSEKVVAQRLKKYFRHRFLQRQKEINRIRLKGGIYVSIGIVFLGFLTLATYFRYFSDLTIELLGIILMPLGWFGVWEGFSKIVDTSPIFIHEEILFDKLSKGQFKFLYIEPGGTQDQGKQK
ncbi:MAG: hypothetical protein JW800_04115 [Candidatus Omnitrophica bacterium]|nr:hypothetical protein [Candidatus Omnitrophota bacterium]